MARDAGETEGSLATVRYVSFAGAVVRLELNPDDGPPLKVEVSRERFEAPGPEPGERLRVTQRKVRVFVGNPYGPRLHSREGRRELLVYSGSQLLKSDKSLAFATELRTESAAAPGAAT